MPNIRDFPCRAPGASASAANPALKMSDAGTDAEIQRRAAEIIKACPQWYHSIELAPGVITPGVAPLDVWNGTLRKLHLPDLRGKSVLDIGAYDGFFSFAAERLGAARVVALDEYVWATDMVAYMNDWRKARASGMAVPAPRYSPHWRPAELPGKRPFDAAREILGSGVESVVGNFVTLDATNLGKFDVVLFLGILYHMEDPLAAIRRVAEFLAPGGFLGIETEAVDVPGAPDAAFFEFFPGNELNNDAANWWAPNMKALEGLTRAAGLQNFSVGEGPPPLSRWAQFRTKICQGRTRFRAVASARAPA
jgi:tRNA (mo5U34)-methyltransferase